MPFTNLASTKNLEENLSSWRVFDCRHDLAKPELGAEQYREGHIPGALFAHLDRDLSGPKSGKNGRHPLPDPATFIACLGRQGLEREDQVVCYDEGSGTMASRLWWMLRWVGHEAAAVLDGGLAKWCKEGRPLSTGIARFPATTYPGVVKSNGAVEVSMVERKLDKILLVDSRSPVRFRGEQEPIDPVAGRIPGAVNRFNGDNVLADGTFKDQDTLRKEFLKVLGEHPSEKTIHYCGSGVAACHNLLAMEIAGLRGAKLYAGSWSEWIADPRRPRARG